MNKIQKWFLFEMKRNLRKVKNENKFESKNRK